MSGTGQGVTISNFYECVKKWDAPGVIVDISHPITCAHIQRILSWEVSCGLDLQDNALNHKQDEKVSLEAKHAFNYVVFYFCGND